MVTRVKVDAPICDHHTEVIAHARPEGVEVEIITDCSSVQLYSSLLKGLTMDDIMDLKGSKIINLASDAGLTATCMIPTAVYNACWVELGLISRRYALSRPNLCIQFLE